MTTRRRGSFDVVGARFFILLGFFLRCTNGLELGELCLLPLGMESGKIRDSALSASTSYDSGSVGPHHARLRNNKQGGAWCPRHMVSKNSREYLEIDLKELHVLTGIKTQGRYGNGQGQEYAEQYMVEYWRSGLEKWVRWKDRHGKELLSGNTDTYTIIEQSLDPPIITSKVRILPYSDHVRTVCLRIELTGCSYDDGLSSYSMPQGVKKNDLDLSDRSYDGSEENRQLINGLGQLTDGIRGKDNFRLDINGLGKGYEWVGWRNDTSGWAGLPLEILFEFDKVRNFSAVHLYTNNLFTKDVQVFSHARTFFSLNGRKFNSEPVHFSYMPDLVMEHSRNVTIKLHQRIGKFLKLQLYFASRWILLSEVSFDSTVVSGNFTQETETEMGATLPDFGGREYPIQRDEVKAASKGALPRNVIHIEDTTLPHQKTSPNQASEPKNYIGFVIGILTIIILALTSAIAFIVLRNRRIKDALTPLPVAEEEIIGQNKQATLSEENKEPLYADSESSFHSQHVMSNNGSNYADIPDLVYSQTKPPPVPPPPENYYTREDIRQILSIVDISQSLVNNNRCSGRDHLILPLSPQKMSDQNDYQETEREENYPINQISSERLRVIEKIGRGQFGDVHLCELIDNSENGDLLSSMCVVYTLDNVSGLDEFKREVNSLSKLRDRNVAVLLGASLETPPYYTAREYAQYGDLCQFLQDHVAESTSAVASNASILSYGCLIYMATQIASGMKHLESMKYVHKDLAARNCLVGENYQIKISDLGCQRDIYSQDYCQIANGLIPLRWMAWESALLGTYSNKSDVWSFAVLLWEILTFAREQPFDYLGDDKLLENLAHFYQDNGKQIYLNIPHNCPKEIYDLMMECWNRNESDRPTFKEMHLFLQRKNLGYKPEMH
ncbi:unnamed protein product [Ceutorhynchus assimilis]|uniref:Uncharacterized protein n=1 Tax=Ceutorhynchus assimilis TaxID=467358 RepID=A0A9N9QRW0_9CUCU|nr:unnamed protein product [Ceutorhynchus assimilis]